jgi:phage repressor protein C with HTH and peptisase S24 domain
MEPTFRAGERLIVDTADRMPSPPGIFIICDENRLAINRVQIVPNSKPMRVKISCENTKYEGYESALENADIQGRVICQWRSL